MANVTGVTRGGTEWTPNFITDLNQNNCIGCGRCFKTCPRDVFELIDRDELELDDLELDCDGDDYDDDNTMVMSLKNPMDCIGCEACSRVCPKKCMTHSPFAA